MATTPNKVKYNLKNVHYAKITAEVDGVPTYAAPVRIPGAVSLSMDQQGEISKFNADGVVYWQAQSNNGYEGDLEIALVPDSFRQDILGETLDTEKKILTENAAATGSPFALLFEFDGDAHGIRHVLYNCSSTRPGLNGKTKEDSIEPDTDTLTLSAVPLADGSVKSSTTADTPTATLDAWYTAVQLPTPAAAG